MATITKSYEPQEVEKKWYAAWLEAGCFTAKANPAHQPYKKQTLSTPVQHVELGPLRDLAVQCAPADAEQRGRLGAVAA